MWTKRTFKAARIVTTVVLASASTLIMVHGDPGNWLKARYSQLSSPAKEVRPPSTTTASRQNDASEIRKSGRIAETAKPVEGTSARSSAPSTSVTAERSDNSEPTASQLDPQASRASQEPASSSGSAVTTGSATTGSATTGSATTTGSAAPVRRIIPVRGYNDRASELRLKLIFKDLNDDLRMSTLDLAAATARGQTKAALQSASDVLARTQERADLLGDLVQYYANLVPETGKRSADQTGSTSGRSIVAAGTAESQTTGSSLISKDFTFGWSELSTVAGLCAFLVTSLVAWFGDNLSERWFGGKDRSANKQGPSSLQTAAPSLAVVRQEPQPVLSGDNGPETAKGMRS